MDIEDDVFDAENNATSLSLQFQLLAIKFTHEKDLKTRHKLLEKCKHLLMNFKRAVLINRRRYQQRMQRRQSLMRFFFIQHLMEMETHVFELFPIHQLNGVQLKINDETEKYSEIYQFTCIKQHMSANVMRI